jgi:hypothetical protein
MPYRTTRRRFLRDLLSVGAFAAGIGGLELGRKAYDLYEQHETWEEASRPNHEFFARHESEMQRLTLGASFAPEQWAGWRARQTDAMEGLHAAVQELDLRQLRLGIRWQQVSHGDEIDLAPYAPLLDYCFANDVDVCLNVGPIKVFRWPEEHVPQEVLAAIANPPATGDTIYTWSPLASAAMDHLGRLLQALRREYGDDLEKISMVQVENEPFYQLGVHAWQLSEGYLVNVAERVNDELPRARILVTSAGRLNLIAIRHLFERLMSRRADLRGRLVSGFDFHYRTPNRDAAPVIRYFDQVSYARPFAASLTRNIWDSRDHGYGIEVTEGQMEPWGQFEQPGNLVRELRYMLLRCLDEVLDPQKPALIRLWGVEELTKRMIAGETTREHRDMIEVIQRVNDAIGPSLGLN